MFKVKAMERAERWHWHTDCVLLHCQVGWFQNWRRLWKSFSLLKNRKDLWSSCPHKVLRGCDSLISKTNHLEVESRASKICKQIFFWPDESFSRRRFFQFRLGRGQRKRGHPRCPRPSCPYRWDRLTTPSSSWSRRPCCPRLRDNGTLSDLE